MERKVCTRCNVEKSIEDFYENFTERKLCINNRNLKRHYENKEKISNQKNLYS